MRAHAKCTLAVLAVSALIIGAGCEPEPSGEQVVGQPSDLVDETYDAEMPDDLVTEEETDMAWTITSSAFEDGEMIPRKYTDDGEDVSPPLTFEGVPEDAAEIVLIMHDPDAPRDGGWTHWVVYGMAPDIGGLPENVPTEPAVDDPELTQGENTWGNTGYGGPAPPAGDPHRYQFRGYALSETLDLGPGASKDEVEAAMGNKIIGEAMLEGLYGRG
ncbi:MAG: YbhB/YbcL family Raf kinase inhibitor-like protein [Armatimonadota bacterium]